MGQLRKRSVAAFGGSDDRSHLRTLEYRAKPLAPTRQWSNDMGILDTLKDAVVLIQKADNIELNRTILNLQTQVFELVEENRALKDKLVVRDQLSHRQNAYWKGDDGPYCTRCWDAENL